MIPTPKDLWGDCEVNGWDEHHKDMWELWLIGIAAVIIFADQEVIERVADVVKTTTLKANRGEMTADEAVKAVSPIEIMTPQEWGTIHATARKQGAMMSRFFSDDRISTGNNLS